MGRAPLQALVTRQYFEAGKTSVDAGSRLERALLFFLSLLDFLCFRLSVLLAGLSLTLQVTTLVLFQTIVGTYTTNP